MLWGLRAGEQEGFLEEEVLTYKQKEEYSHPGKEQGRGYKVEK